MFKFGSGGQAEPSPDQPPSLDTLRRTARHRLLGASALALLAVIAFPWLFDTQPRPVPAAFDIEMPGRQPSLPPQPVAAPAVVVPASMPENAPEPVLAKSAGLDASEEIVVPAPVKPVAPIPSPTPNPTPALAVAPKPVEKPPVLPKPAFPPPPMLAAAKPLPPPAPKPVPKPEAPKATEKKPESPKASEKPTVKPPEKPLSPVAAAKAPDEAARALALLEGKPSKPAANPPEKAEAKGRHVVQVGAFADPNLAQDARLKLERAGVVAYTQQGNTPDGPRTRVRIGPFATRAEADKAALKVRALGLPAAIVAN